MTGLHRRVGRDVSRFLRNISDAVRLGSRGLINLFTNTKNEIED
jgi:hypothetical protein